MPELKPIIIIYPSCPPRTRRNAPRCARSAATASSTRTPIHGTADIVQAADEMGLWGVGTIEHHFWSEGYEVAPAPGVDPGLLGGHDQTHQRRRARLRDGTHNPIRVAEETAVINHLAQGRTFVGLARGYQSRWTNVLGQHFGTRATKSPTAAIYNRADPGCRLLAGDAAAEGPRRRRAATAGSSRIMSRSC